MAVGKPALPIGSVYSGDPSRGFADLYAAMQAVYSFIQAGAGLAIAEAAVAIDKGRAINLINGKVRYADASLGIPAVGVSFRSADAGQRVAVVLGAGTVSGLSGLAANTFTYLGNAGTLVFIKPASGLVQGLGYAASASDLLVQISAP